MNQFILIFDIPRKSGPLRSKIHRKLMKIDAEKIQDSIWFLDRPKELIDLAKEIKMNGGDAKVMVVREIIL